MVIHLPPHERTETTQKKKTQMLMTFLQMAWHADAVRHKLQNNRSPFSKFKPHTPLMSEGGLSGSTTPFLTRESHMPNRNPKTTIRSSIYLYTLAVSPSLGGSRQHKRNKQKQWGFHSVLPAMTRDPAEFGWHCWSNTAHPPPSSTTYVAS